MPTERLIPALRRARGPAVAAVSLCLTSMIAATVPAAAGTASDPDVVVPLEVTVADRVVGDYLLDAEIEVAVAPATYAGRVTITGPSGVELGAAKVRNGAATVAVPVSELGQTDLRVTAAAAPGFAASVARTTLIGTAVPLERGTRSPVIVPLLQRLRSLNYLTPDSLINRRYTNPVSDVVLAFQKVTGLPRTAEMDARTWRALAAAEPAKPRYPGKGRHIEVDKTRQVMMLVHKGSVRTIHVSTGKTGNTPEGRFRIYAKGVGHLPQFMAFLGNFGFHGYVPVPQFPASHGCVREPMWTSDLIYRATPLHTKVFIYS